MKTKLLSFIISLILMLSAVPFSAFAEDTAVGRAKSLSDGIVAFKCAKADAENTQELIDVSLTHHIGVDAEWYILALAQSGKYDFSAYKSALDTYLETTAVRSAVTKQKLALAYLAIGAKSEYVASTLSDTVGKLGIMSYVYGLHLLSNGCVHPSETADTLIDALMDMRLEDGGWATSGKVSDVDVTAMTVQALAPYYADPNVASAVDSALDMLSRRQNDDGSFNSYGVSNPESVSQVITALSALGIDFKDDARFIKNGRTLLDSIESFRLNDGSFSHTYGGEYNANATAQVFLGLNAYIRFKNGNRSIFILENTDHSVSRDTSDTASTEPHLPTSEDTQEDLPEKAGYKTYVTIALILLGIIISLALLLTKKCNIKNIISVWIAVLIVMCLVWMTDIQSKEDYYNSSDVSKNAVGTVTISISCNIIADDTINEYIPENGIVLAETEFTLAEGETVFDILTQAARKYNIHLETNGVSDSVYVSGINYLYEFDYGDMSGWTYLVNGARPSEGCGSCTLQDGDRIEWVYTLELGNDLK